MFLEFDTKVVLLLLRETLCHKIVANADFAFEDEVHIRHFIFLIQNQSVFQLDIKLSRLKPKADLKQKVFIVHLVGLAARNEEGSEAENDIVKQVVEEDVVLDLFWTLIHIFIVNLHLI